MLDRELLASQGVVQFGISESSAPTVLQPLQRFVGLG
jgi:hypothetical protein